MRTPSIDLSECEDEPIRHLGLVQPHGALLLARERDLVIEQVSTSVETVLHARPDDLVGRSLAALLGDQHAQRAAQSPEPGDGIVGDGMPLRLGDRLFTVTAHRAGGRLIVEFEPRAEDEEEQWWVWEGAVRALKARMESSDLSVRIAQEICEELRTLSGYDRVWMYRFCEDWSGEVVAEARTSEVPPYLGLHYPASDIPPQARALYRQNRLRVIANVNATGVPLVPLTAEHPDLGHALLRSVSRYHIEYLQNLGVSATATASVLLAGELWGMFSFHHRLPRPTPWYARHGLAEVTSSYAALLRREADGQRTRAAARTVRKLDRLRSRVAGAENLLVSLLLEADGLRDLLRAESAAVVVDGLVVTQGEAPEPAWLRDFAQWVAAQPEDYFVHNALGIVYQPARAIAAIASGAATIVVTREPLIVVAAFLGEVSREVFWGGDPDHPATRDELTHRLSPRKSFDLWRETVMGTSRPWPSGTADRLAAVCEVLRAADVPPGRLRERLAGDCDALTDTAMQGVSSAYSILDATQNGKLVLVMSPGRHALRAAFCNRQLRRLTGRDLEGLEGAAIEQTLAEMGLPDLLSPEGWPRRIDVWSEELGPRSVEVARRQHLRIDGAHLAAGVVILVFTDVTAHCRLTSALEAARDRIEAADQAKGAMMRSASHELRTPLNAIIGFSDILLAEVAEMDPAHIGMLEEIRKAGIHLLDLVESMLDLTQLDVAATAIGSEWIDLNGVVRDVTSWIAPLARAKGVDVGGRWGEAPVMFFGRPRSIRQILINLLSNALKFTPTNGRIGVDVDVAPESSPGLTIWDTGIGIAEEDQRRIFEPFVQVDASLTRRFDGIGLGLSLVRAFVEMHSGTITVRSSPGAGAAFTITFPQERFRAVAT